MVWKSIIAVVVVACIASWAAFQFGLMSGYSAILDNLDYYAPPQIVELVELVEVEKIVEVERIVEVVKEVEVERVVEVPKEIIVYTDKLRRPSHTEVIAFIARDNTDGLEYDEDSFNCLDYSIIVRANAIAEGIRCGILHISDDTEYAHAIVVFDTRDRGEVFIEPQFDWEVERPYPGQDFDDILRRAAKNYDGWLYEADVFGIIQRLVYIW